jgi:hypothetical protein
MATAASAAFPPASSIFAPIADAVGSFDAHMPFLLSTGERRLFQQSILSLQSGCKKLSKCKIANIYQLASSPGAN